MIHMDQSCHQEILELVYDTNKHNWQVSDAFFYESMLHVRIAKVSNSTSKALIRPPRKREYCGQACFCLLVGRSFSENWCPPESGGQIQFTRFAGGSWLPI